MKKLKIVALTVLIVGLLALVTGFILGFSVEEAKTFFTDDDAFVKQEEIRYDTQINTLSMDLDTKNISIKTHDEPFMTINHYTKSNETWTILENDGVLSITQKTKSPFFSFKFSINVSKNTIYLAIPKTWVIDYTLKSNTGNITLNSVLANVFSVKVDTGNIFIDNSQGLDSLTLKTSTGSINVENTTLISTLKATASTGSITILNCDANNVVVSTDTGTIKSTDLNAPSIQLQTSTGTISIKGHYKEYSLSLATSTGNIKVDGDSKGKIYEVVKDQEKITAKTSTGSITITNHD